MMSQAIISPSAISVVPAVKTTLQSGRAEEGDAPLRHKETATSN